MKDCQTGISAQTLYTFCRIQKLASSLSKPKAQSARPGSRGGGRAGQAAAAQGGNAGRGCSPTPTGGCLPTAALPHLAHRGLQTSDFNVNFGLYFSITTLNNSSNKTNARGWRSPQPGETMEWNQVPLPTSQRSALQFTPFFPFQMKDTSKRNSLGIRSYAKMF